MSRRGKRVLIAVLALALIAVVWFQFVGLYVDFAWFHEVGFTQVFTTQLQSRAVLFLIAGLGAGGLVLLSLTLAYRSRPFFVPTDEVDPLAPYRSIISGRPKLIAIVIASVVGLICGLSAQGSWATVQLWLHSTSFGQTDAEFGHDIGFYVFTLPMVEMVLGWLFVVIALCFISVLAVQYIYGGIRISGPGRKITSAATLQLSLLVGAFVLVKAVQYWFDQYDLLFSNRSDRFTGASYTDINAVLPAKLILMCIAAICAVGFIVGGFLRSVKLPAIALALLVLSSVLIGGAWPLVLQNVRVKPNEITLESTYIGKNIQATRAAYGIGDDKVKYVDYGTAERGTPQDILDQTPLPNARLLDPNLLTPTFIQRQQSRNFYTFGSPLSVDRYTIDGQTEDYIVAAREINIAGLEENQRSWINEHFVYTHGNGFVAAQANDVTASLDKGDGYPNFTVSSVQGSGVVQGKIPVDNPRIYYGQIGTEYAIVGSEPGGKNMEYDTDESNYTYTGAGGVSVGNFFKRLVFATQYGEWNFLLSSQINANSKVLYNRDPSERVKKVAPFLTVDTKPYPAVVDGHMVWIVDGYTTATNYPYAQNVSLSEATNNSLQAKGAATGQADQQVSYIRNSVKATVDAYDGTVKLYRTDDDDPILKAWEGVFPGLILAGDQVSPELRSHFRYPQDLFEVQRSLLSKYQVTDPTEFYQNSNFWQVPNDPTAEGNAAAAAQPPYYLQVKLPSIEAPRFELTSALTVFKRDFMSAYMAASSDPGSYGDITVLKFPRDSTTPGPALIQQIFRNTQEITNQITLLQGSSVVIFGNLLTLPTEKGVLYVEPIYVQGRSANSYPQLSMVVVWFGQGNKGQVGYGGTLKAALTMAAANEVVVAPTEVNPDPGAEGTATGSLSLSTEPNTNGSTTSVPSTTEPTVSGNAAQALDELNKALAELDQVRPTGSNAAVGAAQDRLEAAVQRYLELSGPISTGTTGPSGTVGGLPSGIDPTTEEGVNPTDGVTTSGG